MNDDNISNTQDAKLLMETPVSFLSNTREKQSKAVPWRIPLTFGVLHIHLRVNMFLVYLENAGIIALKNVESKFIFIVPLDILFDEIPTSIRLRIAFIFGVQTL